MTKHTSEHLTFRALPTMVERIDAFAEEMDTPTLTGRRGIAIRKLLDLALKQLGR